jgi:hypothetical protein
MIFDLADLDGFHKSHLRFLSQQTGHLSTVIKKFFFQLHHVQLGMLRKIRISINPSSKLLWRKEREREKEKSPKLVTKI